MLKQHRELKSESTLGERTSMNHKLTDRQVLTVRLVVEHGGYKEAAQARGVSINTVKNTLSTVRKKMGVSTMQQVIYRATKEKLI